MKYFALEYGENLKTVSMVCILTYVYMKHHKVLIKHNKSMSNSNQIQQAIIWNN